MEEGNLKVDDQFHEDDPDIHDTLYPPSYFKVIHRAGVRVREAPLQNFHPESQVRKEKEY